MLTLCLHRGARHRIAISRPIASLLLAFVLPGALQTLSPSSTRAAEDTVRVTIQPTTTALPMVVADKQGMFAKYGVVGKWTVSHVPISDSISTLGRQKMFWKTKEFDPAFCKPTFPSSSPLTPASQSLFLRQTIRSRRNRRHPAAIAGYCAVSMSHI